MMALVSAKRSSRTWPSYCSSYLLAIRTMHMVPDTIRIIAVRSFFQMNCSLKSQIERSRFAMMAIALLAANSVMSQNGSTMRWMMVPQIIKIVPIHQVKLVRCARLPVLSLTYSTSRWPNFWTEKLQLIRTVATESAINAFVATSMTLVIYFFIYDLV